MAIFCLYIGVFLRASADMLIYAYLPFHLYNHLGETRLWVIGLLAGAPSFVRLIAAPLWGKCADRIGRHRIFVVGGLLAYAMLLFLLPRYENPLQIVAMASLMAGIFSAFNPVSRVWLLLSCPQMGTWRLSVWHQWEAAGYLVSSVVIGWVVSSGHLTLTEIPLMLSILIVANAASIGIMLPDIAERLSVGETERPAKLYYFRTWILSLFDILPYTALFYLLASSMTWEVVATTFGLYFTGLLGGSVRSYGLLVGTSTFVSLLAYGLLAGFCQRYGYRRILQIAAWGYTAMYLLMSYPSVRTASCGYLLPMSTAVRTAMNAVVASQVPEAQRGEAIGIVDSIEAGSAAWGAVLGGLIADRQGLASVPRIAVIGSILLHALASRTRRR